MALTPVITCSKCDQNILLPGPQSEEDETDPIVITPECFHFYHDACLKKMTKEENWEDDESNRNLVACSFRNYECTAQIEYDQTRILNPMATYVRLSAFDADEIRVNPIEVQLLEKDNKIEQMRTQIINLQNDVNRAISARNAANAETLLYKQSYDSLVRFASQRIPNFNRYEFFQPDQYCPPPEVSKSVSISRDEFTHFYQQEQNLATKSDEFAFESHNAPDTQNQSTFMFERNGTKSNEFAFKSHKAPDTQNQSTFMFERNGTKSNEFAFESHKAPDTQNQSTFMLGRHGTQGPATQAQKTPLKRLQPPQQQNPPVKKLKAINHLKLVTPNQNPQNTGILTKQNNKKAKRNRQNALPHQLIGIPLALQMCQPEKALAALVTPPYMVPFKPTGSKPYGLEQALAEEGQHVYFSRQHMLMGDGYIHTSIRSAIIARGYGKKWTENKFYRSEKSITSLLETILDLEAVPKKILLSIGNYETRYGDNNFDINCFRADLQDLFRTLYNRGARAVLVVPNVIYEECTTARLDVNKLLEEHAGLQLDWDYRYDRGILDLEVNEPKMQQTHLEHNHQDARKFLRYILAVTETHATDI